jgi:DNA-binding PucR family transcriptional regulator
VSVAGALPSISGYLFDMAIVAGSQRERVQESVHQLACEFREGARSFGVEMAAELHRAISELGGDDANALDECRASCEANLATAFSLLAEGADISRAAAPPAAMEYARSLARRNVSVAALLRAYRLGHAMAFDHFSDALSARIEQADDLAVAVELCSSFMFAYIDRVSDEVVEEYAAERGRWVRSAAAMRTEVVRAVLDGGSVNRDSASASLSYELRRHHVALVLWSEVPLGLDGLGSLERAAAAAAGALGCRDPLIVSAGGATLWAWAGSHESPSADPAALPRLRLPQGVRVAIGSPGFDVTGFRSSHAEAAQAHRIALLIGQDRPQLTWYRDQELLSLLTNDLPRARSFALRELGGLASSEPSVARLRETLRLYLQTWGSHVRTAELLGVHQNTVAYRIRRAEELRGRPASERRPELEAALLLADRLGDEILAAEPGP